MILRAESLSPAQKAVIEQILGRQVLEAEAISLHAFEPQALSAHKRMAIVEALHQCLDSGRTDSAERDSQAASEECSEDILTEAMRSVRPSYRPYP